MGRLIGIDYGGKRTGIAETDDLKMIASPLTTVDTKVLFEFLEEYFDKYTVDEVVIGEPKRLNDEPTHATEMVYEFVKKFKEKYPTKPIHLIDERFTSKMASQMMVQGGLKKKKRREKGMIDKISASIILKEYMESNQI